VGACGWGFVVGGANGAGVIIISLLMAAGLTGAAVIATDAALSVAIGLVRLAVFGVAGVATAKVMAVAILIGAVTLPGAFLARLIVERLPIHIHTAMLDAVVVVGGVVMITGAVGRMG
jgi:vacuolar-type H+-ATPase subunit I/STV1